MSKDDIDRLRELGARVGPPIKLPAEPGQAGRPARFDLADFLRRQLDLVGLTDWKPEHRFCHRHWRFDVAWPAQKVAVECDGGLYVPGGGGHNRPADFIQDAEKRNEAQILGWCVLVVTGAQIASGEALTLIERALAARKGS